MGNNWFFLVNHGGHWVTCSLWICGLSVGSLLYIGLTRFVSELLGGTWPWGSFYSRTIVATSFAVVFAAVIGCAGVDVGGTAVKTRNLQQAMRGGVAPAAAAPLTLDAD